MQWHKDLSIINFVKSRPTVRQFIKFSIIGGFNTLVDLSLYVFFTRVVGWHYLLAATIAFIAASSGSFLFNRYWTFRLSGKENIHWEYLKFILVAAIGLLFTILFLYILVDKFYWYDLLAKVVTIFVVVNWNFWLQKYWTFKVK